MFRLLFLNNNNLGEKKNMRESMFRMQKTFKFKQ